MQWWDIQKPRAAIRLQYSRYIVKRFFNNLETRGGVVDNKAVLFVYNERTPELSYILTEQL